MQVIYIVCGGVCVCVGGYTHINVISSIHKVLYSISLETSLERPR